MKAIDFTVLPPIEELRHDVECIRVATHRTNEPLEVKVCPSGLPGLVFQRAEDGSSAIASLNTRTVEVSGEFIPSLFLHGQGAEPSVMTFKGQPYTTIQIVLKPYGLHTIFGLDAASLNLGFLVPAQFDAAKLEEKLNTADSLGERTTLLQGFLFGKLQTNNKRDEMIERSLDFIQDHISTITVRDILDQFHISERQFQKRFLRVIGMSPQLYIRVKRINEALRMMDSGMYERLSDIAYLLNFYDQSHFIREIKALSWVTPRSITQKVSEFHTDTAGASYL